LSIYAFIFHLPPDWSVSLFSDSSICVAYSFFYPMRRAVCQYSFKGRLWACDKTRLGTDMELCLVFLSFPALPYPLLHLSIAPHVGKEKKTKTQASQGDAFGKNLQLNTWIDLNYMGRFYDSHCFVLHAVGDILWAYFFWPEQR